ANELIWRNGSELRVLPPHQSLTTGNPAVRNGDLRLVGKEELFPFESSAKIGFKCQAFESFSIHPLSEEAERIAAVLLRRVQGGIRMFDQRFGIFAMFRVQTDTDAAGHA